VIVDRPRYRTFASYLLDHFGEKVWRLPINAGFGCPNRDGSIGSGGCSFCSPNGSAAAGLDHKMSIKDQIEQGKALIRPRHSVTKFVAYFQAFTNTYGTTDKLRDLYQTALDDEEIVGLFIGTRSDCLPEPTLDLLAELAQRTTVWLELGLQSADDETLKRINRGHDFASFADATRRARVRNISVAAHVILGLPGETKTEMLDTARKIAALPVDGVKIHLLHVVRGSGLERDYQKGRIQLLDRGEYTDLVCEVLELLPPEVVVMRLTGEAPADELLAPDWAIHKSAVLHLIEEKLQYRDTYQGRLYQKPE
jgi:uncharacterized protein